MSERKRKPPSFPLPDPNQTGDLMNRLQTFLPQLQAANQALPAQNLPRVDVDLQSENDDDDDDDDDDHSSDDGMAKETSDTKKNADTENPTIQIQFALGDMKENPMIKLLAKHDEDNSSTSSSDDGAGDLGIENSKEIALKELLLEESAVSKLSKTNKSSLVTAFLSSKLTETKKPLITELD